MVARSHVLRDTADSLWEVQNGYTVTANCDFNNELVSVSWVFENQNSHKILQSWVVTLENPYRVSPVPLKFLFRPCPFEFQKRDPLDMFVFAIFVEDCPLRKANRPLLSCKCSHFNKVTSLFNSKIMFQN